MPSLPQELIDVIINDVNDRNTLKACSLVASSFVCPSQRLLFHTVDLDTISPPRKIAYERFLRLVTSNPLLGTYVRSLRLGDGSENFGSSRSWIIHTNNLPQLFQLLPRLEFFSLTFNSDERNWKSIPADIRSAFERLFHLPTVQAVSLKHICGFPPQLLFELMRLKQLSLSFVDVDANDIHSSCHLALSGLRGLHLRGTPPPTIAAITRCLLQSSPTLRILAITPTIEPGFCIAISELMIAAGSNITQFEWLPSIHFASSSVPLDITRLPHLRFLRFSIAFRKFSSSRDHFTEMLHLLNQVSTDTDNKIEIIELECSFMRWIDKKVLKTQWGPLEMVLDKVGFRNSLKKVKVKLLANTNVASDQFFKRGFMDLFSSLRERGVIILVSASESSYHCH